MGAALVVGLAALEPQAQGQVTPTDIGSFTNLPSIVNVATTSNQTSVVTLWQGKGLAVQATFTASAGTSNVVYSFYPSADGTNYATAGALTLTCNANDTTKVIGTTNWSAAQLAGWRSLKLGAIYNQNATGIVTNQGVIYSRPY